MELLSPLLLTLNNIGGRIMANKDFQYDPEAEENSKKYRLPYALCKAKGIKVEEWWKPSDCWRALKNGGYIKSVPQAYKDYYIQLRKERQKEYNARATKKRQQLKSGEHNPTKDYIHKNNHIDGAIKSSPMDFKEADSGNCNPFYQESVKGSLLGGANGLIGYRHNCQTCVATYVARRKGYNVRALPNLNNKAIYQLSYKTNLAYLDSNNKHPNYISVKNLDNISNIVKQNEIYTLEFDWKGKNSGHIIIAERNNQGNLFLYDPQTNEQYFNDDMYNKILKRAHHFTMLRVDNCNLDENFCDKIMKGNKK